jgi:hypothetical protein
MRIYEIIFRNNEPVEMDRPDPLRNVPTYPYDNELSKLAGAFTKNGAVKHFWYLNSLERQPSEPAPPTAAGTELIPSDDLEPAITSWEADPGEEEPYCF